MANSAQAAVNRAEVSKGTQPDKQLKFTPQPEARIMNWVDLRSPVQTAVRDLLIRIEGATQRGYTEEERTVNSFLVHGERGTGKTTVLLCAKNACDPKENFFPEKTADEEKEKPVLFSARNSAGNIKKQNVEWLDVLDLEPLPAEANLLTTVLTRVGYSLQAPWARNKATEVRSILEEGANSARRQLTQLIKDATLMWGDIRETDTRSRANQQVVTADIYAQFRDKFISAMDAQSRELSRWRGSGDGYYSLILPVDNIDRSPEHLRSIVKLAQMVSCPYLWLVMAGDRQDVDTFLERAYWKELISLGEGAGVAVKAGLGGEDETLVMARRQAAAASHKLLPPSHRVRICPVKPEETLQFSFPSDKNEKETIRMLLDNIKITETRQVSSGIELRAIKLIELFDVSDHIKSPKQSEQPGQPKQPEQTTQTMHPEQPKQPEQTEQTEQLSGFTEAAQRGLSLSARGVLDLWQAAHLVLDNDTQERTHKAEQIARTMLRNAIAESTMSGGKGLRLKEHILRRTTPEGGTILDLSVPGVETMLETFRLEWLDFCLRSYGKNTDEFSVTLEFGHSKGMILRLVPQSADVDGKLQESFDMLPDLVAAWLTVLHDVVRLGAKDSLIIAAPVIAPTVFVNCIRGEKTSKWPMPRWESFVAHDLNGQMWLSFRKQIKDSLLRRTDQEMLPRLLAAGWAACALETFLAFVILEDPQSPKGILSTLINKIPHSDSGEINVRDAETDVMDAATKIYDILEKENKGRAFRLDERTLVAMRDWLECSLPYLLSNECVPTFDGSAKPASEITKSLKDTGLAKFWTANAKNWNIRAKQLNLIEDDKKRS